MTGRMADGLSRTNNSLEGWHNALNNVMERHPRVSRFVKKICKEITRSERILDDFYNAPGNGIRRGIKRKSAYVQQDTNLQRIFANMMPHDHI